MGRRWVVVMTGVVVTLVAAGCATPGPPREVSAVLPKHTPLSGEDLDACRTADTLVVVQCRLAEQYDSTVQSGWVRNWYLSEWQVIRVERGRWPDETISFVFRDSWPTSESGFVLRTAPPVYYEGAVMAFCIDTSRSKPTIVAQQTRSRAPSYGSLKRPRYDPRDPESVRTIERVLEAARRFLGQQGGGSLMVTEEYDDFFVVELKRPEGSLALRVEKDSYRVTRIPDAFSVDEPAVR